LVVEAGHYTFPDVSVYDAGHTDGVSDTMVDVPFLQPVPGAVVFS